MLAYVADNSSLSAADKVSALIREYRRRATWQVAIQAILWLSSAVGLLSILLLFALGWWGGSHIRISGLLLWMLIIGAVLLYTLILPLRNLHRPSQMARRIGDACPSARSAIISADELLHRGVDQPFSRYLLQAHLERTYQTMAHISPSAVLPPSKLLLPGMLFVLVAAGVYLFGSIHQPVIAAGLNSLFSDRELPEQTVLRERLHPVVSDLSLRLKYPAYLGKKEKQFTSFSGGLEAPLGTTVILEATPIESDATAGDIALSDGSHTPLSFLPDGRVVGKFLIDDIEWFSISLGNDRSMIRGPKRTVHVETDRRPTIRLLRPTQALEVNADGDVYLEYEAHDDHGIGRIDLIVRGARDVNLQKTITHAAPNVTHIRSDYQWNVSSVRLEDIHDVELLVRVYDDDTIRGPKYSNSEPVAVKIMTPKSRQQELIVKQGQILDGMVDLLAHRLSTPVPVSYEKADDIRDRYLKLRGETEDVTSAIAKLLNRFEQESAASLLLKDTYRQIRQDITNQILFEASLNELPLASYKKRVGVDSVTVRLLERSIAQVDDLILDMQFYTMNESGKLLEQQRNDLVELLHIYQKRRSERTRQNLSEAILRMQRTAQYLAEKMSKVRGQVASAAVSQALDQAIDLDHYFKELERSLGEGNLKQALALAEQLEQTISQLMAGLEGGHLAFKNERFGKHNEFIGHLLDKLNQAEAAELQLRRKTIGIQRQYKEKVLIMMRGEIDGLVKTQSRKVKQLRTSIEAIRDKASLASTKLIMQLRELTKRMDDVLQQGDLDRTMEFAREIQSRVRFAKSADIPDTTYADLKAVESLSQNIVRKINESFPNPARVFNDRNKRDIRNITFNQRRVMGNTRGIVSWLKDQKSDLPFLGEQTRQVLSTVIDHMRDSTAYLENRNLQEAAKSQTLALDALSKLKQRLKSTGTVVVETTATSERRKVVIPGPRDYEVPKKHRDDILKAMRAQLPEQYKEAIKKYYETLVR
ncbi:MAG: DUF4175 family protein [Deltaproteobacteria bacterium]|nr:DUF4175 family protein [Deltaproteobacteria bacterium]MBN2672344.1 DUF4175 family protein [Deltaproteobacteria bacterium]